MSVPITTLTTVTSSAWVTVSRIAAAVCSLVMVFQNSLQPPSAAVTTTAASGISTSTLNQIIATPSPSPTLVKRPPRTGRRRRVGRSAMATAAVIRPCRRRRSLE